MGKGRGDGTLMNVTNTVWVPGRQTMKAEDFAPFQRREGSQIVS